MIKLAGCSHEKYKKSGKTAAGTQRFKCKDCGKRFAEDKPLGDMRVDEAKAMMVIGMLLEGMSVRAASRLTGMDAGTICDLILVVGDACQRFMDRNIKNVPLNDLQIDEIWSFVGMKQKKAKHRDDETLGDSWTYIAIDRETKLVAAHLVADRNQYDTQEFLARTKDAVDTSHRFQVSTDGWGAYQYGVPFALGSKVDYGQLIKNYASQQEQTRYSPAQIISAEKKVRFGNPDPDKICTSHVESFNQKFRMQVRRFARLTNAHSKSLKHHTAMQSIFFAHYNFCRAHSSLGKQTPAMAAGIVERKLTIKDLLN